MALDSLDGVERAFQTMDVEVSVFDVLQAEACRLTCPLTVAVNHEQQKPISG
jgi:hypothetical protein